ncbi:MAG: hypothetical protein HOD60_00160 [Candidatus Nitrosopelagicus sp.]|nr:hypothetical protein [Candidatus Nitrosopelagicus sp.]
MTDHEQEHKQPKSVLWHSSNPSDFLKQNMGMIQANSLYNNEFLQASEVWKFTKQVIELINQDVIDLRKKPELQLNQDAVIKLGKIYNGGCYLITNYEDEYRFKIKSWSFQYEYPTNVHPDDIQELPSMKSLNPTKTIDSKDWSISIRASIPFKYAFAGYDYATVIQQGNFIQKFSEGIVPRFEEYEIHSTHLSTHDVSKKYFNTTLEVLKKFWLQQWIILFTNIHKIIEHLDKGSFQTFDKSEKSLVSKD